MVCDIGCWKQAGRNFGLQQVFKQIVSIEGQINLFRDPEFYHFFHKIVIYTLLGRKIIIYALLCHKIIIYALFLCPESFCAINTAIRKVFNFSVSDENIPRAEYFILTFDTGLTSRVSRQW